MNKLKAFCRNEFEALLLGLTATHLEQLKIQLKPEILVHKKMRMDYQDFFEEAQTRGFRPWIVSGFRSFERQLKIWNDKCDGLRPIYDDNNNLIDPKSLSEEKLLFSILRFSALPGASRHHWGTDFDIADENGLPHESYQIQLTQDEFTGAGPFAAFHDFIDDFLIHKKEIFRRPYQEDKGTLAVERWHLSYQKESQKLEKLYTQKFFNGYLDQLDKDTIRLYDVIQDHKEEIYQGYIASYFS